MKLLKAFENFKIANQSKNDENEKRFDELIERINIYAKYGNYDLILYENSINPKTSLIYFLLKDNPKYVDKLRDLGYKVDLFMGSDYLYDKIQISWDKSK